MKLKFKLQSFQTDAVNAVVDLFQGQEKQQDTFTLVKEDMVSYLDNGLGVGNRISLSDDQLLANMREVQKRQSLPLTGDLNGNQFSIEMETGTGKTYVYTKTIFELHKQYGFTKFIVVVPSVAIREGVYKSFEITREHFAAQYDNVPVRFFIYNSSKLSSVRAFAVSSEIEIMIINIDAFKKSENIINQAQDRLNGETAMRYIQDTNPIVIIDEPQSVDNTDKAKEAIASLHPLCVFRYSATHREKINLLYRLTPVDAYQMGLVKQICVSSNQLEDDFNRPYIRLAEVSNENGFSARIEIDRVSKSGKVERKTITIKPNADLYMLSGERSLYEGYTLAGIDCTPGREGIEFSNGETLALGKSMGDVDEMIVKRAQIRRTIEAHLEKELRYTEKGIKVLSLFFIDEVRKYRLEDGGKGVYALAFEDCYRELMALPKFAALRERFPASVESVHDGYFSQDKKGNYKNTRGDTQDDYDTYSTIMKDKEWLLSFDCPLRFIFSHSTLKEGWDNPNVFQVCTLIEQKSTFTCRQKVGRGLRLCVDQTGERIEDRNINILHVMANESFAEFADTLQREIEQETGVKFGMLQIGMFSGLTYTETVTQQQTIEREEAERVVEVLSRIVSQPVEDHATESMPETVSIPVASETVAHALDALPLPEPAKETILHAIKKGAPVTVETIAAIPYTQTVQVEHTVSHDEAEELMTHFEQKGYVSSSGQIKDTMKNALRAGTLDLPAKFESARERFETIIRKADQKPPVHDAAKEVRVRLNKQVMLSPEFMELWNRIKQKTAYRVRIDEAALKERCIEELRRLPAVPKARIITRTARINVERAGVSHTETELRTANIEETGSYLPDFLRISDAECFLPQRLCVEILLESGRGQDFLNNPQRMTELFIEAVRNVQGHMEIDGIRYIKLDGEEYFLQEIFDSEELIAYLGKNAVEVQHSVYDHVIYDSSTIERPFAVALDNDPDVKMFFKIPSRFKIETPIGNYNPDWAVYMDKDGEQKLYFVIETKGTRRLDNLRTPESDKIKCGEKHFEALEDDVSLRVATDWREFKVEA